MSSLQSPARGTKDLEVAAVPATPAAPVARQAGPHLLASWRLQTLHIQHRSAGRARRRTEPVSPLPRGSGPQPLSAGSRPLRAAGPGLIDSDLVDEEVLRALVLELGLDRADELPELWLGHHEFDCPADLPASC